MGRAPLAIVNATRCDCTLHAHQNSCGACSVRGDMHLRSVHVTTSSLRRAVTRHWWRAGLSGRTETLNQGTRCERKPTS